MFKQNFGTVALPYGLNNLECFLSINNNTTIQQYMKPFHYNQDPLYAAAASILQGHLTEDADVHPNIFVNKIYSFMQDKKKEGLDLNELISALNFKLNIRYENLDTEKQKAILKAWKDLGGPIDYRKNPNLKENVVAFKNRGFKQLNGLLNDDEIYRAVNSTIKRDTQKLSDSTWNVVTDIYGKRAVGEWAGDWIMARKGGGSWLTIKDGETFKAHDSISSVLSFFEMEEEVKVDDILKQNKQEWDKIKSGKLELIDSNKLYDELYTYFSSEMPYGVAKARDGDPDEWIMNKLEQMGYLEENIQEGDEGFHSQKMIKNQLNTIVRNSNICLQMIEDDREFPEWAQSEIAVAEDGIVSVAEYMESHSSDKGEKVDEALLSEQTFSEDALKSILNKIESQSFKDWYDNDFTDYIQGDEDGKTREEILEDLKSLFEKGYIAR